MSYFSRATPNGNVQNIFRLNLRTTEVRGHSMSPSIKHHVCVRVMLWLTVLKLMKSIFSKRNVSKHGARKIKSFQHNLGLERILLQTAAATGDSIKINRDIGEENAVNTLRKRPSFSFSHLCY